MNRILLAMIVLGGAMAFAGVQQMRLAGAAKPQAQAMSCAKLIRDGVGDNAHVLLTDFIWVDSGIVTETGKRGTAWKNVWVPVVPFGGEYHKQVLATLDTATGALPANQPKPTDIRVIVQSSRVADEAALEALAKQDTLDGVVVNKISSLGSKQKQILAESYPGVNFDNVLVLEHGRVPWSSGKSVGTIAGGAVLSLLGVLGFIRRRSA
jgi:hypothetical protein